MTGADPLEGRHLVLVGLMGSGKSTVGERCAARLGRRLVDTDRVVESDAQCAVAEIFAREGEAGFRRRERDAVEAAAASAEVLVIACGGGAVLDPDSRRRLREAGVVVWLRADPATLADRLAGAGDERPLLAGHDPVTRLRELATERADAYREAAHVVVDTDALGNDEVAVRVLAEVAACTA